ncbi:MAG: class I SAM-dependent methyltransferase [Solirubrobacterales bacterium]|nr:class I SAM-dependent methyltransferase [Solirubrobacterales bacterium]
MELLSDGHDHDPVTEIARIEAAYRERDAAGGASIYRFTNAGYTFYMQALEWSLLDVLRHAPFDLEGSKALDIGCGSGYLLHRLMEFGVGTATGVDLMPGRIEAARRRYPQPAFVCANAADLPFADGEFDLVTQFTCLSSVLDPGLRSAIAAEMWRVVRPGGIIVSYDMQPPPWPVRLMRQLGEWRRQDRVAIAETATPTTPISADELRRLFPAGDPRHASVALAFGLCETAARSHLVAQLLACIPILREHAIGVVLKPCED